MAFEKLTFISLADNSEFAVQFNPTTFSISKCFAYTDRIEFGRKAPKKNFAGGKAAETTVELLFDSTSDTSELVLVGSPYTDVTTKYEKLVQLAMPVPSESSTGKGEPPRVRLIWGTFGKKNPITCVITRIAQNFTLFAEDGTRLRATVSVTLSEFLEEMGGTNPTSRTEAGRTWVVEQGQRLDFIAAKAYGRTSAWRFIAETNNIADPLGIRPGQILRLPELPA